MKLYEIDNKLAACILVPETDEVVDTDTGEIIDIEAIRALQMERAEKIEGLCLWYKNLCSDADQIKSEEKNLKKRRESIEKKAEQLFEFIQKEQDGEKFQTSKVAVNFKKNPPKAVGDFEVLRNSDIGLKYMRFKDPEPKLDEIKRAIQAGTEIPGYHLEQSVSMSIK